MGPWLRLTACAMYLAYIAAVFGMSLRVVKPVYALVVGLITAMHVQTVFMSDFFAADVPFALFTTLFFLVAAWRRHGAETSFKRHGALEGGLAVAAFALRTAGVALLAAWIVESVLDRRAPQVLARLAVTIAAVTSWQLYVAHVRAGPEYQHPAYAYQRADYQFYNVGYGENMRYVDTFRPELGRVTSIGMVWRALENSLSVPLSVGEAVTNRKGWWEVRIEKWNQKAPALALPVTAADVVTASLSVPVAVGLVLLAARGYWLLVLYTAGALTLIALTPWPGQFSRYLIPVAPVLALAMMYLVAELMRWLRPRAGRWLGASRLAIGGAVAFLLLQQVYTLYATLAYHHEMSFYTAEGRRHEYPLLFYDRIWRLHDEALDWLAHHSHPGEVVATSTPHRAYLRTGLPAIMPPFEADPAVAQKLVDAVPITYLIVDHLNFIDVGRRYTIPLIAAAPDRWSLVYFANDTGPRIYRRVVPLAARRVAAPSPMVKVR
ncbi:MAG: hypothetical protein ACTHM9_07905 [Gemmatimonadales bacterium]